jgi:hypothetical protein
MKQISLATTGFELATKRTRKREFLDEMNLVIPLPQLLVLIALMHRLAKRGVRCLLQTRPCKTPATRMNAGYVG